MNEMKCYLLGIVYFPLLSATSLQNHNPVSLTNGDLNARIVGGQPARAAQFPFAAAIQVEARDRSTFCGGALISQRWILTSSYCVTNAVEFTITLGSNKLTQSDSNRVMVSTQTYYLHPQFNQTTLENDIALIQLRQKVEFSDYIDEINLPVQDYAANVRVTGIGWGQTSDDQPGPAENLNFVELVILSNNECKIYYGSQILDTMVCVSGQGREGICTGDSGSPLIYLLNSRHPIVVGVASFHSSNGCESYEPSGYTRTFPHTQWILNQTSNLSDE